MHQLYNQYSQAMFSCCMRMCKHREDAEDVLQEAFVAAFRNIHTFNFESTFGAWLKRIVINRCINHLNRKAEHWVDINEEMIVDDEVDFSSHELIVEQVNEAIINLPAGYRVITSLYLLEGYDHQEIAEILNISVSTSKSQLLRAKRKIKEMLEVNDC